MPSAWRPWATLAIRHAESLVRDGLDPLAAAVDGSQLAFRIGVVMCVIGGILVIALLEHVIAEPRNPLAEEIAAD